MVNNIWMIYKGYPSGWSDHEDSLVSFKPKYEEGPMWDGRKGPLFVSALFILLLLFILVSNV